MPDLLRSLVQGAIFEEPVALVVAHPDDEILGLGGRLRKISRLTLVHLTDGAPRDMAGVWRRYARVREAELRRALTMAGAKDATRLRYGYPDQQAILHNGAIVEQLGRDVAGAHAVITHPYEHGHPDHDAAALSVALACAALRARGYRPPRRYEFASYHFTSAQPVYGFFWPDPCCPAVRISLSAADVARKRAALACFGSQQEMIGNFPLDVECVRRAPRYDFRRPAPPCAAFYDGFGWAMTSARWRALAGQAVEKSRAELPSWA